jgi:hypothetical protein
MSLSIATLGFAEKHKTSYKSGCCICLLFAKCKDFLQIVIKTLHFEEKIFC